MLPPGHIAAGYLAAYSLLKLTGYNFDAQQVNQLLFWGMFFGFVPDMDMFAVFIRVKSFSVDANKSDHRKFITHTPLFWLIVGLVVYLTASGLFVKTIGLLIWFGAGSHLFLDTIQHGIPWLRPFSDRLYALKDRGLSFSPSPSQRHNFFSYWLEFTWLYATKTKLSFYLELVIIVVAVLVYTNVI